MSTDLSSPLNAEERRHFPILMFDLGGVLYHINLRRTSDCFSLLAGRPVDFSLTAQHAVFDAFERGELDAQAFRSALRDAYGFNASDEEMDAAWNALLVGLDDRSCGWLDALSSNHRIILLSNINEIHHRGIADECAGLFSRFEHLFLSYETGHRKPEAEIYQLVLREMNCPASDILYFDDAPQHVATARSLGIHSVQVPSIDSMPQILAL